MTAMPRFAALAMLLLLGGCGVQAARSGPPPVAPTAAVGKGVVEPLAGLIEVAAARDGRVVRLPVEEGVHVVAGQPLAVLDTARAELSVTQARLEADRDAATARGARSRWILARADALRLARLAANDAASGQEADQQRVAADAAKAALDEADLSARAGQARLGLARLDLAELTVRSPVSGIILRRHFGPGAAISAASPTALFLVAPDGPRVVRAELDEAFADQVAVGMPAWITDATGGQRVYRGHVLRVSPFLEPAANGEGAGARLDLRVIRLVVAFDEPSPMRLGQRVLVRINP